MLLFIISNNHEHVILLITISLLLTAVSNPYLIAHSVFTSPLATPTSKAFRPSVKLFCFIHYNNWLHITLSTFMKWFVIIKTIHEAINRSTKTFSSHLPSWFVNYLLGGAGISEHIDGAFTKLYSRHMA